LIVLVAVAWLAWRLLPDPVFAPIDVPAAVEPAAEPAAAGAPDRRTTNAGRASVAPGVVRHDLAADEARGGHTIARHVGRTDDQLRERLAHESISAASTYTDLETAERVVGVTLRRHASRLAHWKAREGPRPNLVLPFAATQNQPPIGRVLRRGASTPVNAHAAVVVLRWRPDSSYVLTSYPEDRARGRKGR
jgi:hypothetical protein